jgi:hypothetical protein
MTTTTTTPNGTKDAAKAAPAQERPVHRIPLSKIFFDPSWNARSAKFTSGTGDDGEDRGTAEGIVSLKESMRTGRQDTPALVRPIPPGYKGAPKGAEYLGVFGFRRNAALALLASEGHKMAKDHGWDPKNPTIDVAIDNLDEVDALAANIAENTARDDLRAPDLAFQIHNYLQAVPADDTRRRSVSHMAKKFGKVERYVRRLTNISQALLVGKHDADGKKLSPPEPKIFAHWRDAGVHVPVKEMDTLVKNPGPYQAQYDNLVGGQRALTSGGSPVVEGAEGEAGADGSISWIDKAIEKAEMIGKVLGTIEAHCKIRAEEQGDENLNLDISMVQWDETLLKALSGLGGPKVKKSANGTEKNRVIAAAKRGVREGRDEAHTAHAKALADAEEEEEEGGAEGDEAEAAPKGKKAN